MDSVVGEIKISSAGTGKPAQTSSTSTSQAANQGKVEAVKWATLEPGTLSVAIGDSVHDYDTTSSSRPVLIRVNHVQQGHIIKDIALYGGQKQTSEPGNVTLRKRPGHLLETLYPRRMLAVLDDRTVYDMAKHGAIAPVAISRRDGRLVHALGSNVWVGSTTEGPSAMESSNITCDEDISATMMRRARCLRVARYSMNTSSNIKMLSEDLPTGDPSSDVLSARLALLRLWSWIDRIESLSVDAEDIEDECHWPAKGLLDAGMLRLLGMDTEPPVDDVTYSDTLSCYIHDSAARR
jgi:hypothetical protein